jgi:hypothetical protein
MSQRHRDNYVNLKINGRLFPSWVAANFKDFKLDEIEIEEGDPCKKSFSLELKQYQIFASRYMDFNGPYKTILLWHSMGSGKTAAAINTYNMLYNYTPGWNVFILLKATLKDNWNKELDRFLSSDDKAQRKSNIVFISYDSPIADKTFMDEIRKADTAKKNLFIIEEAHNFISNVYSNISTQKGKRAQVIYDYIIQDSIENPDTRIIVLTATPGVNSPYEIALLFNLLRPGSFPKSESMFNQEFISGTGSYRSLNPERKNLFQRRIMGLVSYYNAYITGLYAEKTIHPVNVKMSQYQEDIYNHFEQMEEKQAKKKKRASASSQTYKSYTRQASNFVFPFMAQGKSGENRPRPRDFSISERVGQDLLKGRIDLNDEKDKNKYFDSDDYLSAIQEYVRLFEVYINKFVDEDERNKHTILDDFNIYRDKYNGDFEKFNEEEKIKSQVYEELYKCSAKFLTAIFIILNSKGPAIVYSNYVLMEGLEIFKVYLKFFGFTALDVNSNTQKGKDFLRFTEYHGMIEKENRGKIIESFNREENKYGAVCKIFLLSSAGAEGLNLLSIRTVHILESFWHHVRLSQIQARGIRLCSHKFLPMDERHVDIYRYKSVRGNYPNAKQTTDQYIESVAKSKEALIQSFLEAIKEVAIDCALFKNHNMITESYKCFQFTENNFFEQQIPSAYREDIQDDIKWDNGLNASNSIVKRIKVIKIKAVLQLNEDATKFSQAEDYYYYPETHVVYDPDLFYAVGKVATNEDGIPTKLNKDTYVIDKVIPIPMISRKR